MLIMLRRLKQIAGSVIDARGQAPKQELIPISTSVLHLIALRTLANHQTNENRTPRSLSSTKSSLDVLLHPTTEKSTTLFDDSPQPKPSITSTRSCAADNNNQTPSIPADDHSTVSQLSGGVEFDLPAAEIPQAFMPLAGNKQDHLHPSPPGELILVDDETSEFETRGLLASITVSHLILESQYLMSIFLSILKPTDLYLGSMLHLRLLPVD